MVNRDQPFAADDDNYVEDEDEYVEDEDDDPTTLDDWIMGSGEPLIANKERRLLAELDARIHDLADRVYYREMAAAAGTTVDMADLASEKARHAELLEFRRRHPGPADGEPAAAATPAPTDQPPPTVPAGRRSPVIQVEIAIKEALTASEMLHWQELQKGTKQTLIAEKLGISQGAVSKRERALRERIDAISVETIGRPYPAKRMDRGLWARQGRRRNKSAPRQR